MYYTEVTIFPQPTRSLMTARIIFFPVGNGDMTLIGLADPAETKILIDCNIRSAADDPQDPTQIGRAHV